MPDLLQFHQCSYSFLMTVVTLYKEHADPCEEHRRHKYWLHQQWEDAGYWMAQQRKSLMFICHANHIRSHSYTDNKAHRNWTNERERNRITFSTMLYLWTTGVKCIAAFFIRHPPALPQSVLLTKLQKWLQVILRRSFAQVVHLAATSNTAACASSNNYIVLIHAEI